MASTVGSMTNIAAAFFSVKYLIFALTAALPLEEAVPFGSPDLRIITTFPVTSIPSKSLYPSLVNP
ncbi:hypothetical protein D3C85_1394800 [compost metagenome]